MSGKTDEIINTSKPSNSTAVFKPMDKSFGGVNNKTIEELHMVEYLLATNILGDKETVNKPKK